MDIFIQASQFILSLSLLIILHEMGHFIPAKLFKTRVEKFYLFFDPWFSLVKKKIGGTEYGIGWLPLGGYVKISGMVDESMDKEQMKQEPKPWEFRSKPAWQRLIIMIGGVTVNVILAVIIYTGMMMYYGEETIPAESLKWGVAVDSTAQEIGLRGGDKVVSIDGKEIETFRDISLELLLGEAGQIKVERDGQLVDISVTDEQKGKIISAKREIISPRFPYVAGGTVEESAAAKAGFEDGDSLLALNGEPMYFFDQYQESIPKHKNEEITITIMRSGEQKDITVMVPEEGKIGLRPYSPIKFLEVDYKKYGFFEAIPAGFRQSGKVLTDYIRQFRLIFNPETGAYKELGGFIMIANQFDTVWNWQKFWGFTAFLSIMLAFLNILPIPALDGGHVVFVLWEMITGRKPSEKVLEYAQVVGFVILLGLIIVANGNDIIGLFNK
jgi:regulator of sigma E protease